jgi:hypothetical protein
VRRFRNGVWNIGNHQTLWHKPSLLSSYLTISIRLNLGDESSQKLLNGEMDLKECEELKGVNAKLDRL